MTQQTQSADGMLVEILSSMQQEMREKMLSHMAENENAKTDLNRRNHALIAAAYLSLINALKRQIDEIHREMEAKR